MLTRAAATLLALLLAGCSSAVPPSQEYLSRLSNVLDAEPNPVKTAPLLFPEARDLRLRATEQTISIREFLGLRHCKLHLAIAERNSLIGKVANSSQYLINDIEILASGPACLTSIDDTGLQKKLATYLAEKQQTVAQRLWHALLAEAEYQQLWQSKPHQPQYPHVLTNPTLPNELVMLTQLVETVLNGQFQQAEQSMVGLENTLGKLRHGDAGQLLAELESLSTHLTQANQVIEQRLQRKLCANGKPTPTARHFKNVVNKFFIGSVQAHAVELKRRHQQIMPLIHKLEKSLLPFSAASFQEWLSQRNTIIEEGINATQIHAIKLQALYHQCGLNAGNRDRS